MADVIPNILLKNQAEKKVDFVNDTMRVALVSGVYDECSLVDALSFGEVSANELLPLYGYPEGGFPCRDKTITVNDEANEIVYDMLSFGMTVTGGTLGPVRYAVMYDVDYEDSLVYIFDFGEDKTVNDGAQFEVEIDSRGLMKAKQGNRI